MKATYHIDHESHIIFAHWSGKVTRDEAVAASRKLLADPAFSPFYDRIFDARDVTEVQLSKANLMELAMIDPIYPSERRAVVTSSSSVFGMGRMFGLLTGKEEQGNYRVFSDYEQALEWIRESKAAKKLHGTKMAR